MYVENHDGVIFIRFSTDLELFNEFSIFLGWFRMWLVTKKICFDGFVTKQSSKKFYTKTYHTVITSDKKQYYLRVLSVGNLNISF